jgi:hypothetical protein
MSAKCAGEDLETMLQSKGYRATVLAIQDAENQDRYNLFIHVARPDTCTQVQQLLDQMVAEGLVKKQADEYRFQGYPVTFCKGIGLRELGGTTPEKAPRKLDFFL